MLLTGRVEFGDGLEGEGVVAHGLDDGEGQGEVVGAGEDGIDGSSGVLMLAAAISV